MIPGITVVPPIRVCTKTQKSTVLSGGFCLQKMQFKVATTMSSNATMTKPSAEGQDDEVLAEDQEEHKANNKPFLEELINGLVGFNDVQEDDKRGNSVGVCGFTWDKFSSKHLRMICVRLGIKGYKNKKKSETIDIIDRWCKCKKSYQCMQEGYAAIREPRKEVQCAFRLINILFSDEFAADFATIGNVANRALLDSGKAGNDMYFWEKVQAAFVDSENEFYNQLQFVDDAEVFDSMQHINPGNIVFHDWKKLRSIWKKVNASYKGALSRFTVSGTHTSNFFGFLCNGDLESYYLRLHLQQRPELNGMVEADLPGDCFVSSEKVVSDREGSDTTKNHSSSSAGDNETSDNGRRKKRIKKEISGSDDDDYQVATAIRDYAEAQMRAEVAKNKLRYMEAEDSRRRKKVLVHEWERLQANIRLLRQDLLLDESILDSASREGIKRDIANLTRRKVEIDNELGFDSC